MIPPPKSSMCIQVNLGWSLSMKVNLNSHRSSKIDLTNAHDIVILFARHPVPSVHVWHLANEKLSEGSCAYKLRGRSRSSSQARLLPWPEDPKKGEWCLGQVASGMLLMVVGDLGNLSRLWIRSHNNAAKKCLQLKFTQLFEYHKKMPTRAYCWSTLHWDSGEANATLLRCLKWIPSEYTRHHLAFSICGWVLCTSAILRRAVKLCQVKCKMHCWHCSAEPYCRWIWS